MIDPVYIEATLLTARAVAIIAGALVALDYFTNQDTPPHNPKMNALAWLIIALSAALSGGFMLYESYGLAEPLQDIRLQRAFLWGGIATGLTMRAANRAQCPKMIWLSASIMGAAGLALSLVDTFI